MKKGKVKSEKQKCKPNDSLKESDIKDLKKKDEDVSGPNEFDFGGLPDRDLKKNLGCG